MIRYPVCFFLFAKTLCRKILVFFLLPGLPFRVPASVNPVSDSPMDNGHVAVLLLP
jgi:hypothetical protein